MKTTHNLAALTVLISILSIQTQVNAQEPKLKTVSPDGKTYAVWLLDGWDETIAIYDQRTGALKHRMVGHGDVVEEFRYSIDGQILAAKSRKGWRIWNVSTGKQMMMLSEPNMKAQSKEAKTGIQPRAHKE